jgi:hypothetical protein
MDASTEASLALRRRFTEFLDSDVRAQLPLRVSCSR